MNEPLLPEDERRDDESLSGAPLSPVASGKEGSLPWSLAKGVMVLGAIGGIFMLLFSSTTTSCRGATRSWKLKWEQRQLEMDQAERDAQAIAAPQADVNSES